MSDEKKVILSVRDLNLYLRATETVINYGSFDIEAGDFVILKGNNGSGKSTFFRIFCAAAGDNYCDHAYGSVRYLKDGFENKAILARGEYPTCSREDKERLLRRIVYISQEERFSSYASAEDAILQPTMVAINEEPSLTRRERDGLKARAKQLCDYYFRDVLIKFKSFDVSRIVFKCKRATAFSGGQQKMLSLIGGLIKAEVMGAHLVLMDEPLNNLDSKNKAIFRELLDGLRKSSAKRGAPIAIVAITHCQIFEGINKVITITADPATKHNTAVCTLGSVECHRECLEDVCPGICGEVV